MRVRTHLWVPADTSRQPFVGSAHELAAANEHVSIRTIGSTAGGRGLSLLSVGAPDATWATLVVARLDGRRSADETRLAVDIAAWLVENRAALPPGCAFAPRCPFAVEACSAALPELVAVGTGRWSRCARWQAVMA